jgi:hypothetical protein
MRSHPADRPGGRINKWFSLIDKVWSERTLELAWEKVKSNAGACGADGITTGRFAKDSQNRLLVVKEQLKRNAYQPKPVKRVWMEKPGSAERRPLGIPTVTDRVVQAAVRMFIEPIFENRFAKHSYGFRPGRGCKDALRRVEELLRASWRTSTGRWRAGSDTSSTSIPASWVRSTNGCGCVCAPSCESGGAAGGVAGGRITIAGQTATLPDCGSFAC